MQRNYTIEMGSRYNLKLKKLGQQQEKNITIYSVSSRPLDFGGEFQI